MTDLEKYVISQLMKLVPNAEKLEFRANISDKSFSVEFFAFIGGVKHQCYDMIDNGIIKEEDFDSTVKQLAKFIRSCPEYRPGEVNKFSFTSNS